MTAARYRNAAQQRVLRTLRLLSDLGPTGASPSYIATDIGTLRSNTTRDLANLRIAGLATSANGRWYAASGAAACLPDRRSSDDRHTSRQLSPVSGRLPANGSPPSSELGEPICPSRGLACAPALELHSPEP